MIADILRGLKFLAAAGYNFDRDDLNDVEVIQLFFDDNVTLPVCKNLPPFPVYTRGNCTVLKPSSGVARRSG